MTDDLDRAPELDIPTIEPEPEAPEPEASIEETAGDDGYIELGGRRYAPADLEPIASTLDWARSNPERWEQIRQWEQRGYILPDTPQPNVALEPPAPADEDEWVDPRVRALEERYAALERTLEQRQYDEDRASIDSGLQAFEATYSLSDEDRRTVLRTARDWNLVAGAVEREQNPARRAEAVRQAFEYAYRIAFFERAGQDASARAVTNMSRARRAARPGTARPEPRTRPVPEVHSERDLEMALKDQFDEIFEANR